MMRIFCRCLIILWVFVGTGWATVPTQVALQTNYGDIVLELYPAQAPITVQNFLDYTNSHFYDGLIFHRVIFNFMIQGGGYDTHLYKHPTNPPIVNESYNGLSNLCGTIAMARTPDPNSATSEFFINQNNNLFLDRANAVDGYGYCVFGHVTSGMDIVDSIASVETGLRWGFEDFPLQWVIIQRVRLCVYVTPTGNDTTGTGAVDKPFKTIQKAINTVSEPTSIMVAPGTYYEKINFNGKNVAVTSLDPTDPTIVATTIIDAGRGGRAVTFTGTETSVAELSGLTIKNGSATAGGAIYGGAPGAEATIHSNVIISNSATNGGAIANCDGAIHHNVIRGNSASALGGGLYACGGQIYNNTIYGNTAANGGGLANCGQAEITNCIVWGNSAGSAGDQIYDSAAPFTTATYSCVQGGMQGLGNLSRDPLFADAVGGDVHLKCAGYRYDPQAGHWVTDSVTSPCIDTGSPGFSHDKELGSPNLRVNMGAYGNTPQASVALPGWALTSDINNDGRADSGDMAQMAADWLRTVHPASDVNHDGIVNSIDFAVFAYERFQTAGWCWSEPDLSGDGNVDFIDFARAAANWGKVGTGLEGDFNADTTVDDSDMAFFAGVWLK